MKRFSLLLAAGCTLLLVAPMVGGGGLCLKLWSQSRSMSSEMKRHIEENMSTPDELPTRPSSNPTVRFVHVTDTHLHRIGTEPEEDAEARLRALVALCNEDIRPDFVVHTGDFVYPGTPGQLSRCRKILDQLKCPWIPVCGNHDGPEFATLFGPINWSFDEGGWHFVVFPVVDTCALKEFSLKETMSWFRDDLAASSDKPTILFTHDPVFFWGDLARSHGMMEQAGNVVLVLSGHLHTDLKLVINGVTHITSWMFARSPHRFRVCDIYPEGIWISSYEDPEARGNFLCSGPEYFIPLFLRGGSS